MILPPPAASKSSQDCLKFGQDGPRSFQDGSKTSLRRACKIYSGIFFVVIDFAPFGLQLGLLWTPAWDAQDEPKIDQKKTSENHVAAR